MTDRANRRQAPAHSSFSIMRCLSLLLLLLPIFLRLELYLSVYMRLFFFTGESLGPHFFSMPFVFYGYFFTN